MLKSKLDAKKYPCITDMEEIKKLVAFYPNVDPEELDPIFLGRYAALCKRLGTKGRINSGKRNHEKQIQLYIADGGYQKADGTWDGGSGYVARPGTSWHEFRMAIDTDDLVMKALEKDAPTSQQVLLKSFGLFKPLTKGNKVTHLEDWHIQPIETLGIKDKKSMEPILILNRGSKGNDVMELQTKLQKLGYPIKPDGDFGEKTESVVKLFQKNKDLKVDGIAGPRTLEVING